MSTVVSYPRASEALSSQQGAITRRASEEMREDDQLESAATLNEAEIYAQLSHILNILEAENAPLM